MTVAPLRWGDAAHLAQLARRAPRGFETLLASDVLYAPREYAALARSVHALAADGATVLLAYPERHGEEAGFVQRLTPAFERVREERMGEGSDRVPLQLVELRRVRP